MGKSDLRTLLESMDERHETLLAELDALNSRVEAALFACGFKGQGDEGPAAKT